VTNSLFQGGERMLYKGNKTQIKSGDFVQWDKEVSCITAFREEEGSHDKRMLWEGGDNKKMFPAIRTESDFVHFVMAVSDMLSLDYKRRDDFTLRTFQLF